MSPLEAWRRGFTVTAIRLPADPDELDVVCSDAQTCTLTTKGIQFANCVFNSDHLQAMLRDALWKPGKKTLSVKVEIRYNRFSMAFIWVMDPATKVRLQVPNLDATKATLSAFQIKVAQDAQHRSQEAGHTITMAEAIKKVRDANRDLNKATTQGARRRALKVLGLNPDESLAPEERPPPAVPRVHAKSGGGDRTNSVAKKDGVAVRPQPRTARPADDDEYDFPLLTAVVRNGPPP